VEATTELWNWLKVMELPKVQSSLLSFGTCTATTSRQLLITVLYRCLYGVKMT